MVIRDRRSLSTFLFFRGKGSFFVGKAAVLNKRWWYAPWFLAPHVKMDLILLGVKFYTYAHR